MKKIAVIDYGMSNLHSVLKSFQKVINKNYNLSIAYSSKDLEDASILILPGQGAASSCLDKLSSDFPDLKRNILNKPFLGICLGFQILFNKSYEDGGVNCFSLIDGEVKDFRSAVHKGVKVPHMGWNKVKQKQNHILWKNIPDESFFYFVHSYYAQANNELHVFSDTYYEINFTTSVMKENIFACQFHPEKSSKYGLQLLSNFINWTEELK
jgi:glutamine amidotransferase|tara:strand:- start:435 stop:1067 length:633 start_codon:yes stop_codon:yes gene_type:complete